MGETEAPSESRRSTAIPSPAPASYSAGARRAARFGAQGAAARLTTQTTPSGYCAISRRLDGEAPGVAASMGGGTGGTTSRYQTRAPFDEKSQ